MAGGCARPRSHWSWSCLCRLSLQCPGLSWYNIYHVPAHSNSSLFHSHRDAPGDSSCISFIRGDLSQDRVPLWLGLSEGRAVSPQTKDRVWIFLVRLRVPWIKGIMKKVINSFLRKNEQIQNIAFQGFVGPAPWGQAPLWDKEEKWGWSHDKTELVSVYCNMKDMFSLPFSCFMPQGMKCELISNNLHMSDYISGLSVKCFKTQSCVPCCPRNSWTTCPIWRMPVQETLGFCSCDQC